MFFIAYLDLFGACDVLGRSFTGDSIHGESGVMVASMQPNIVVEETLNVERRTSNVEQPAPSER